MIGSHEFVELFGYCLLEELPPFEVDDIDPDLVPESVSDPVTDPEVDAMAAVPEPEDLDLDPDPEPDREPELDVILPRLIDSLLCTVSLLGGILSLIASNPLASAKDVIL